MCVCKGAGGAPRAPRRGGAGAGVNLRLAPCKNTRRSRAIAPSAFPSPPHLFSAAPNPLPANPHHSPAMAPVKLLSLTETINAAGEVGNTIELGVPGAAVRGG